VKRLVMLACCLMLLIGLTAAPLAARAQGPGREEDYAPLIFGDNVFSLLYPSQWTYDSSYVTNGAFVFTSDPAILTRPADQAFAPGEVVVTLNLLFTDPPVDSDAALEAILTTLLQGTQEGAAVEAPGTLGPIYVSLMPPIGGLPAVAQARLISSDAGDGLAYLWTIGDRLLGIVLVQTASGEMALQEPAVLTLIQSVQFNGTLEDLAAAAEQGGAS
jgi:hypothetical protein